MLATPSALTTRPILLHPVVCQVTPALGLTLILHKSLLFLSMPLAAKVMNRLLV